ncbi:UNVERIFIED_CONTAM: hypothetical protein FKN15_000898 [Acipenser sinensis]
MGALNFQGRLKFLHGQNKLSEDGTLVPSQLALFAIGTPLQPPSILEIRTKTLIFQTKHKLDFTPMGCDTRGKVVLGYTETELCMRGTGYQFIHAADMMHCADNHVRMIKTGESGLTVFRLLTKNGSWVWVQANARLIYKGGRPDFIVARQRALSNEEGEEHLRQRTLQLPFNFATGEAVLYETGSAGDDFFNIFPATNKKGAEQKSIDPNSLLGARLKQDQSIYVSHAASEPQYSLDKAVDDTTIVNVLGDHWIPGIHRQNTNVKEESETLAMMEALEKLFNGNDLQHVDGLELKHWEETLLKMDINNSEMSIELNDILNNDIFAYVEDALFKEQCKPNNNGKDNGRSSINSLANQMDSIGVVQPNLFEGQLLNGFVAQFGKQTCSQLPQDRTLQDFQEPPLQSFQATQMYLNQQLLSAHQISTQPNQVGMDEPSLAGFQGFLQDGPQNHIGLNVSNDMQPRLQQQSPANLNTPNSFVHFSSQDSMELNANSQLQFGQTLAGPCAQNLMGHSLQQNAVGSQGLFDHGQPQIPQNNMDGYSQNQIIPNPQANNGQPNPLALQSQLQKSQLMPAQQLLNPMSSTEDSQWVTSTSNTNYTQNLQQVPMSAQNELQRDLLSLPQNTLMMNQLPKQHHHQANLVQRMQQLQLQAVTQNGQLYPTEPHQERVLGVQPIVSYSQTQELQSIPQISSLLAQNSPFQQCGLGFGPQQISKVYQTPVGSAGLPSTSSCMFKSNSSPPMNGVQFSSMEHSTPSCLNIKPSPNQIPLQASCYYQTKPSEPIVGTTVIAQDDISISPPSCQFQPGFPPEILLEQCFINCNGQTPQPGHPMEENGELPYTALPHGNTHFPKHSGQASCCDY